MSNYLREDKNRVDSGIDYQEDDMLLDIENEDDIEDIPYDIDAKDLEFRLTNEEYKDIVAFDKEHQEDDKLLEIKNEDYESITDEEIQDVLKTSDEDLAHVIEYETRIALEDVIEQFNGYQVSAMDMYSDIFKLGEGYLQNENENEYDMKANPIMYFKNNNENHGHYRIMFEDSFEDILNEAKEYDFAIMNAITYFGRKRDQNHASKMFAIIIDLDYVDSKKLLNFLNAATMANVYPIPNYLVLSGSGVHLYYVFEDPIPLYPNIKLQLKNFKYTLIKKIWNQYTSNEENPQMQGIYQPFRIVDGKTKYSYNDVLSGEKGEVIYRARAYRLNVHPFNLNSLGEYIPEEYRVDESKLFRESQITLEEAKDKYPEWYEKVIVNGDRSVKKWDIQGKVNGDDPIALYNWWLKKIEEGATYGHRYFCIMCLVIYGVKCNLTLDKIKEDAYELIPFMNSLNIEEPFTKRDVDSALDCFDDRYCTFPIKDISAISHIPIPKNKRNGRKQSTHLKIARSTLAIMNEDNGKTLQGRPDKAKIVSDWRTEHPDGKKIDCERDTGLSRHTVIKWWNQDK